MKLVTRWVPLTLLVATLVSPSTADAQRRRGDSPDREQLEQRIREQMGRRMQERLGLNDTEAARLSEVVQTFETQRRELAGREQQTRRRVDELARSGAGDQEALALLRLQAELRTEEARLFSAEQDALLRILSPRQVLTLQELRQDLGRRIRALRGGGSGDPRGPGPRSDGRIGEIPRDGARSPAL